MMFSPILQLAALAVMSSMMTSTQAAPMVTPLCGKPADIVFVVDNSNSIWVFNYQEYVVPFINRIVELFDVGPEADQTRIGVVRYGDNVRQQFHLNDHLSNEGVKKAISDIQHEFLGRTFTDKALNYAVHDMFTQEAGSRDDVAHIIVLITDGVSSDKPRTKVAVQEAKSKGIAIFAIGVGDLMDDEELSYIASQPTERYKFMMDDYGALDSIKEDLALRTCGVTVPPTTPEPTGLPRPSPDCGLEPADIFFLLDSSTSILREDFENRMLSFLRDVVSEFNVSPDRVRVGVMTFSTEPQIVIGLEDHSDKKGLLRAINPDVVRYTRGGTNTASALREVRQKGFAASPSPDHVTKMVVVITDGRSWDRLTTKHEAHLLRRLGVTVYAVGVGRGVHQEELEEIVSLPREEYAFSVPDFKALSQIKDKLIGKPCPVEPIAQDSFVCGSSPIDITLAFDPTTRTTSETKEIFDQLRVMNHRLFPLGGNIRTGVASGRCSSELDLPLAHPGEANMLVSQLEHKLRPRLHSVVKDWKVSQKKNTDWLTALNDKVLVLLINKENIPEFDHIAEELSTLKEDGTNVFVVLEAGLDKKHVNFWMKTLGKRQVLDGVKPGEDFSGHILEFICSV